MDDIPKQSADQTMYKTGASGSSLPRPGDIKRNMNNMDGNQDEREIVVNLIEREETLELVSLYKM